MVPETMSDDTVPWEAQSYAVRRRKLEYPRDYTAVHKVLSSELTLGVAYKLSVVGEYVKQGTGLSGRGVLRGFLDKCDYAELDTSAGQDVMRLTRLYEEGRKRNCDPVDIDDDCVAFLRSAAVTSALRSHDVETWDKALKAASMLLDSEEQKRLDRTRSFVVGLAFDLVRADYAKYRDQLVRSLKINEEEVEHTLHRALSRPPRWNRPDEVAKAVAYALGEESCEVECVCMVGIVAELDSTQCMYRLCESLSLKGRGRQMVDLCGAYGSVLRAMSETERSYMNRSAWTLAARGSITDACTFLSALNQSIPQGSSKVDQQRLVLLAFFEGLVASSEEGNTTFILSAIAEHEDWSQLCEDFFYDDLIIPIAFNSLTDNVAVRLIEYLAMRVTGEVRRVFLHTLHSAIQSLNAESRRAILKTLRQMNPSVPGEDQSTYVLYCIREGLYDRAVERIDSLFSRNILGKLDGEIKHASRLRDSLLMLMSLQSDEIPVGCARYLQGRIEAFGVGWEGDLWVALVSEIAYLALRDPHAVVLQLRNTIHGDDTNQMTLLLEGRLFDETISWGPALRNAIVSYLVFARCSTVRRSSSHLLCEWLLRTAAGFSLARFCEGLWQGDRTSLPEQFVESILEHGGNLQVFENYIDRITLQQKSVARLRKPLLVHNSGSASLLVDSAIINFLHECKSNESLAQLSKSSIRENNQVSWCVELLIGLRTSWDGRRMYCLKNLAYRMRGMSAVSLVRRLLQTFAFLFAREIQELIDLSPDYTSEFLQTAAELFERLANAIPQSISIEFWRNEITRIQVAANALRVPKTAAESLADLKAGIARLVISLDGVVGKQPPVEDIIATGDLTLVLQNMYFRHKEKNFNLHVDEEDQKLLHAALQFADVDRFAPIILHDWLLGLDDEDTDIVKLSMELIEYGLSLSHWVNDASIDALMRRNCWPVVRSVFLQYFEAFPRRVPGITFNKYINSQLAKGCDILCLDDFRLLARMREHDGRSARLLMQKILQDEVVEASHALADDCSDIRLVRPKCSLKRLQPIGRPDSGNLVVRSTYAPLVRFWQEYGLSVDGSLVVYALVSGYWKTVFRKRATGTSDIDKLLASELFGEAYQAHPHALNREIILQALSNDDNAKETASFVAGLLAQHCPDMVRLLADLDCVEDESSRSQIRELVEAGWSWYNCERRFIVCFAKAYNASYQQDMNNRKRMLADILNLTYQPEIIAVELLDFVLHNPRADDGLRYKRWAVNTVQLAFERGGCSIISGKAETCLRVILSALDKSYYDSNIGPVTFDTAYELLYTQSVAFSPPMLSLLETSLHALRQGVFTRPLWRVTGELSGFALGMTIRFDGEVKAELVALRDACVESLRRTSSLDVKTRQDYRADSMSSGDDAIATTEENIDDLVYPSSLPTVRSRRFELCERLVNYLALGQGDISSLDTHLVAMLVLMMLERLLACIQDADSDDYLIDDYLEDFAHLVRRFGHVFGDDEHLPSDLQAFAGRLCTEFDEVACRAFSRLVADVVMDGGHTSYFSPYDEVERLSDAIRPLFDSVLPRWIPDSFDYLSQIVMGFSEKSMTATDLFRDMERGSLWRAFECLSIWKSLLPYQCWVSLDNAIAWCKDQPMLEVSIECEGGFDGNVYLTLANHGRRRAYASIASIRIMQSNGEPTEWEYRVEDATRLSCTVHSGGIEGFALPLPKVLSEVPSKDRPVNIEVGVGEGGHHSWHVTKTGVSFCYEVREEGSGRLEIDARSLDVGQWPILFGRDRQKEQLEELRRNLGHKALVYGSRGVGKTSLVKGFERIRSGDDVTPVFITCEQDNLLSIFAGSGGLFGRLSEALKTRPGDSRKIDAVRDRLRKVASLASEALRKEASVGEFLFSGIDLESEGLAKRGGIERLLSLNKGRSSNRTELINQALQGLWELGIDRVIVYIDEAQLLFANRQEAEDRIEELQGILGVHADSPLNSQDRPNMMTWVFIGCGSCVRLVQRLGGSSKFVRFFGTRVHIDHFAPDESEQATRSLLGVDSHGVANSTASQQILGNMVLTPSAVQTIVYYTGGHARSMKRVMKDILEQSRLGKAAFYSNTKRYVFAGDIVSLLKDSGGSSLPWRGAQSIVEDDLDEVTEDEREQLKEFTRRLIETGKNELSESECKEFATADLPLLVDRGILRQTMRANVGLSVYRFSNRLYQLCYELEIRQEEAVVSHQNEVDRLQKENEEYSYRLQEANEEIKRLNRDMRPIHYGDYVMGDKYVNIQVMQQNVYALFGAELHLDFTRLVSEGGPNLSDWQLSAIANAANSIKSFLPSPSTHGVSKHSNVSGAFDDDLSSFEVTQTLFIDGMLSDASHNALPTRLREVRDWTDRHKDLLNCLGIDSNDPLFHLAHVLSHTEKVESIEPLYDTVLNTCNAVMRATLVFWVFDAVENQRIGDYRAAVIPISCAFERLWKSLMVDAIVANDISSLLLEILYGRPLKRCILLSSAKGILRMTNELGLGGICRVIDHEGIEHSSLGSESFSNYHFPNDSGHLRTKQRLSRAASELNGSLSNVRVLARATCLPTEYLRRYCEDFKRVVTLRNAAVHGNNGSFSSEQLLEFLALLMGPARETDRGGLLYKTLNIAGRLRCVDIAADSIVDQDGLVRCPFTDDEMAEQRRLIEVIDCAN